MPFIVAKPFPFQFDFDHVALLCIDMQRDFCMPGGVAESWATRSRISRPVFQ
jgi:nicotinamidase-related amidase